MSKYVMGVDMASGTDHTAITILRKPNWWERLLRRLKLSKSVWEWKLIDSWAEPPATPTAPKED